MPAHRQTILPTSLRATGIRVTRTKTSADTARTPTTGTTPTTPELIVTALPGSPAPEIDLTASTRPLGAVDRARLLATTTQHHQARGAVLQSMHAHRAVLLCRPVTRHRRHALLTVLTLGAWAPAWASITLITATRRDIVVLTVDETGVVSSHVLRSASASRARDLPR